MPVLGLGRDRIPPETAARDAAVGIRQALDTFTGELKLRRLTLIIPPKIDLSAFVRAAEDTNTAISLEMFRDRPITDATQDTLRFADYAFALATVIDHPAAETPFTIAVNAPWGAGKTSIAELTAKELTQYPRNGQPAIICWFNAWQNDDAPRMATPLAATVARTVGPLRSPWRRLFDPLPTTLLTPRQKRRRRLLSGLFFILAAVLLWLLTAANGHAASSLLGLGGAAAFLAGIGPKALSLQSTASDVATLVRSPEMTFSTGSLSEVSDDLGRLIHQATQRGKGQAHRRLVVFVDDIERCEPPRSIEVCEAVNHLLSHEDVVVILLGDLQTIATAAETKYHDLLPRMVGSRKKNSQSYGELYLEKVIQFRFDVPRLDRTQISDLVDHLLKPSPPEIDEQSKNQVVKRKSRLGLARRPLAWVGSLMFPGREGKRAEWERRRAEAVARGEVDDNQPVDGRILEIARRLSRLERIEGPEYLLAAYKAAQPHIDPKPRDVKRLLNRVRFCLAIADRRALLEPDGPLSAESIGKWSVIVERWPDVSAAIGQDPDLLRTFEEASADANVFDELCSTKIPRTPHLEAFRGLVSSAPRLGAISEVVTGFTMRDG